MYMRAHLHDITMYYLSTPLIFVMMQLPTSYLLVGLGWRDSLVPSLPDLFNAREKRGGAWYLKSRDKR